MYSNLLPQVSWTPLIHGGLIIRELNPSLQHPGYLLTAGWAQPSLKHQRWDLCSYRLNTPNSCTAVATERDLTTSGWPDHGGSHTGGIQTLCSASIYTSRISLVQPGDTHTPCNKKPIMTLGLPNSRWLYFPLVTRRWSRATWSTSAGNAVPCREDL